MIDRPLKVFAILVAVGPGLCATQVAGRAQEKNDYKKNFYHDFRTQGVPLEMTLFGDKELKYIKADAQGLRIAIPRTYTHPWGGVGCRTTFGVQGDFEITTTFEILNAEPPAKGYGVGPGLRIQKEKPATDHANVARLVRTPDRQLVLWNRSIEAPGEKSQYPEGNVPCTEKVGRLRLKRSGATLSYLWAPGVAGDDFNEIMSLDFGANDLRGVSLYGGTGGEPLEVDVRFMDLRIQSGGLAAPKVNDPAKAVGQAPAPEQPANPEAPPSRGWLAAALLIGVVLLVFLGAAVGVGIYVSRRQAAPVPAARPVRKSKR